MTLLGSLSDRLRQPRLRRRALTLTDQGASSLSNILIFVLVARSFDSIEPVGAFGAAMIAYQVAIGVSRALVGQPFLSLYSHVDASERDGVIPHLHSVALAVGITGSALLVAVSVTLGGVVGSGLVALAVVLPALMLQDTWRFAFVVDRPALTLIIDLIWLAVVVAAFPLAPDGGGLSWFVLVWGLGGGLGAAAGWVLDRRVPRPVQPVWWVVAHQETGFRFLGEFLTARGAHQLVTTSLGAFVGLGALGAVRASEVYYGPHNMLHEGMYLAVVPEGVQMRADPQRLRRMLARMACGLSGIAAVWMLVGAILPHSVGEEVFGAAWQDARELMLPMGVGVIATAVGSGGLLGLRSLGDARRSLGARLRLTPWQVVCPLAGAVVGGALGFVIGFAVARLAAAVIWWRAFDAALRDQATSLEERTPAPALATSGRQAMERVDR